MALDGALNIRLCDHFGARSGQQRHLFMLMLADLEHIGQILLQRQRQPLDTRGGHREIGQKRQFPNDLLDHVLGNNAAIPFLRVPDVSIIHILHLDVLLVLSHLLPITRRNLRYSHQRLVVVASHDVVLKTDRNQAKIALLAVLLVLGVEQPVWNVDARFFQWPGRVFFVHRAGGGQSAES